MPWYATGEVNDNSQESGNLRRSPRIRKPPQKYGECLNIAHELNDPLTVSEAFSSPKKIEWEKANKNKEIESLHANNVWDLNELPRGRKTIGCILFKQKRDADGNVQNYEKLDCQLKKMGLKKLNHGPCVYTQNSEGEMVIVGVFMDDLT